MNIKAWVIIRDGVPVHVRLAEDQAEMCAAIERRVWEHEEIKVIPVNLMETVNG